MVKKLFDKTSDSSSDCNGCGVCMLSCPVWRQSNTQALTMCGRARLSMGGASEEELAESAQACILCGSCETLCPRGLATQQLTIKLRQQLVKSGLITAAGDGARTILSRTAKHARMLIPGAALRARKEVLDRCLTLLGDAIGCSDDDGTDLIHDLEAGRQIDKKRLEGFLGPLREAREVIASDGMMVNFLSILLGSKARVRGLGQALLDNEHVRSGVRSTDLYIIETRAFNGRRAELVMRYEALRRETGCFMNLDLHRVATPTGGMSIQYRMNLPAPVSVEAQVQWILQGRNAARIVVEHLDDGSAFRTYASIPVVHLAEATL